MKLLSVPSGIRAVESHVDQPAHARCDVSVRDYKYVHFALRLVLRSRLYPRGMNYVYIWIVILFILGETVCGMCPLDHG